MASLAVPDIQIIPATPEDTSAPPNALTSGCLPAIENLTVSTAVSPLAVPSMRRRKSRGNHKSQPNNLNTTGITIVIPIIPIDEFLTRPGSNAMILPPTVNLKKGTMRRKMMVVSVPKAVSESDTTSESA
ncbi:hypothetical protein BCR33DRAFT_714072 [Rhizoclosmatium globosum]|uniref:Uncharacterized protein n=1 Tax=Rhizoclosmatium globosum TaxID=329046 RepID=A0A1Y2CRK6_9FUNG|nr:hypothetical protein BCR33DRAFT_714072 [Rhizoclosmatium globosum]|eukprot:ORY48985.1 hypothetical protein BCR33DRAFT_714072 [Rhizoclosmatium globosum]